MQQKETEPKELKDKFTTLNIRCGGGGDQEKNLEVPKPKLNGEANQSASVSSMTRTVLPHSFKENTMMNWD